MNLKAVGPAELFIHILFENSGFSWIPAPVFPRGQAFAGMTVR